MSRKRGAIEELKQAHKDILQALAQCKFLTVPHLVRLGLYSERYVRGKLEELQSSRKKPLVNCIKYGKKGGGRRPYYYYLTSYGRICVARACHMPAEKIKAPGNYPDIERDYMHRTQHIGFVVDLYRWAREQGIGVEFFDHYFDWTEGRVTLGELTSKTRIGLTP